MEQSAFDLCMPFDRHLRRREEPDGSGIALRVDVLPGEDPPAIALRVEVLLLDPGLVLFEMPSPCPLPQDLEDGGVHGAKGCLPGVVSVIGRPSPDHRIEQTEQVFDLCLLVGLDNTADLLQERVHVPAGWLGDVFAVVFAYMVSKGLYRDENVFEDADLQMAGYAAALRVLTRYTIIDGRDMTAEAIRPRVKGKLPLWTA
jgi:hypothetical protein